MERVKFLRARSLLQLDTQQVDKFKHKNVITINEQYHYTSK